MRAEDDVPYPSTTWAWRRVKVTPPARAIRGSTAKPFRWFGLAHVRRAHKVTIVVTYRGGAQAWYLVEARGRHGAFPGDRALHDVVREICQAD